MYIKIKTANIFCPKKCIITNDVNYFEQPTLLVLGES